MVMRESSRTRGRSVQVTSELTIREKAWPPEGNWQYRRQRSPDYQIQRKERGKSARDQHQLTNGEARGDTSVEGDEGSWCREHECDEEEHWSTVTEDAGGARSTPTAVRTWPAATGKSPPKSWPHILMKTRRTARKAFSRFCGVERPEGDGGG